MIEERQKEIDGAMYSVTQFPARRSLRMKAKVIKLLGPILANSFDKQSLNFSTGLEMLFNNLNEVDFENLCMDLLVGVRKNNVELTPSIVDIEFAGDLSTLYKVLLFVLEVNYADFFEMIGIGFLFQEQQQTQMNNVTKKTFMRA